VVPTGKVAIGIMHDADPDGAGIRILVVSCDSIGVQLTYRLVVALDVNAFILASHHGPKAGDLGDLTWSFLEKLQWMQVG
jgi:hypothetical protein